LELPPTPTPHRPPSIAGCCSELYDGADLPLPPPPTPNLTPNPHPHPSISVTARIIEKRLLSSNPEQCNLCAGVEDYYTTLLAYYGITSFSMSNAISEQLRTIPALRGSVWPGIDNMHPSCIGTKYIPPPPPCPALPRPASQP